MNEEIKALIDREAEERFSLDIFKAFSDFELSAAKFEFKNGALFALSLFRWRKVSEELPKVKDKPYQIIAKDEYGDCDTYHVSPQMQTDISFYLENYKYWMPIPEGGKDE